MKLTIRLFAGLADRFGGHVLVWNTEAAVMTAELLKTELMGAYPDAAGAIAVAFVAKNRAYAAPEDSLSPDDEIALIPPVSGGDHVPGGEQPPRYALTEEPIDVNAVSALVNTAAHGASLVFVGTTREWTDGKRTVRLDYEAYEPMALATLRQIGDEIAARWPGAMTAIVHRLGTVALAEASVVIAVSTPHRADCFEASRYAIERLKQIVPIWKKEIWEDGSEWKGQQLGPWNPLKPA